MKPLIALVGRQNVGKSTLFNRLTRASSALTANYPGLTRDRHYGLCSLGGRAYWLVDTGGADAGGDELSQQVAHQLSRAIQDTDALLLIVDGTNRASSVDRALVERMRRTGKPWMLLLNKMDATDESTALAEFSTFGAPRTLMISAAHGTGIDGLLKELDGVAAELPQSTPTEEEGVPLAIVGRPGTGKSTLVNTLLGDERMVVSAEMGTTRDSIRMPCSLFGRNYVLVDTAGMRRRRMLRPLVEKFSVAKTLDTLKDAPLAILMINAEEGWVSQDARLLGTALEMGSAVVIAANKWDTLDSEQELVTREEIQRGLCFAEHVPCVEISAKRGVALKTLFSKIAHMHRVASRSVPTSQINQILFNATRERPPPISAGRRLKLRYAHSGGNLPTVIVIHGSRAESVTPNYRSYLERTYREALGLEGVPVKLIFRNNENPYQPDA
jgi:GTP-binding protein